MDVLIVGASVRAAAYSARRAGLIPGAVDLFADRDLVEIARCVRVPPGTYPLGLLDAAAEFPDGPCMYTGALENRPDLLEALAVRRPLWGNPARVVRQVRDPLGVRQTLQTARLPVPDIRLDPDGLPRNGSWLAKPHASAGGRGILPLRGGEHARPHAEGLPPRVYYQERVRGLPVSAVFVGRKFGVELAGVSLQLIGQPGAPFGYRGSLAPFPITDRAAGRITAIGEALGGTFGLLGLFGVDLILDGDTPWPVEVNPRYTASVEVIELASGRSLLAEHGSVFEGTSRLGPGPVAGRQRGHVAKEILFAARDCTWTGDPTKFPWHRRDEFEVPDAADLPDVGALFGAGDPVLTVFARGETPDETLKALTVARRLWMDRLRPVEAPLPRVG